MPTIDRSQCPKKTGNHGTHGAYRHGCRCPDAIYSKYQYRKRNSYGLNPEFLIDGLGCRRRYQALSALGWPAAALATELGLSSSYAVRALGSNNRKVQHHVAARFVALYERLEGTPGPSSRTRDRARRARWAPPCAWDGINIDDRSARPRFGANPRYPGQSEVLPSNVDDVIAGREHLYTLPHEYRLDVIEQLDRHRLSAYAIAHRLDLEVRTVERYRAGIRARAQAGQLAEAG